MESISSDRCSYFGNLFSLGFWAVAKGSWYFDPEQLMGFYIFGQLPIEEVLFFVIVPLMVVLTYLALIKLSKPSSKDENSNDLR